MLRIGLPVFVALCAFLVFLPALDAKFVNWDDDKVILKNANLRGFSEANIRWMFTQTKMGHYHPLTWVSYDLDHAIGQSRFDSLPEPVQQRYDMGFDPKIVHLTNMLLHAAVAVLFYFLARLLLRLVLPPKEGASDWPACVAAFVAAIVFACHPLRVETVAWATERRDVLSSVFLIPALLCYVRYAISPSAGRKVAFYVASIGLLLLSLLSKAWGITLPAVMLVLDVYPLRRIGGRAGWTTPRAVLAYIDKVPYLALAAVFAVWAGKAQETQLATMKSLEEWGAADRIAQAFYGLFFYSYKTILPLHLTPLVPLPVHNDPFALRYVVAALVVLAVAVLLLLLRRRWPAGLVLGICYAGILSPVLGVAQSGPQLVADRYSYLACLTWGLLAGAGLLWLMRRRAEVRWVRYALPVVAVAAVAVCATFAALTWQQTKIWQDSWALWRHAVKVDPQCATARLNLGLLERQAGNVDEAIKNYKAGLAVDPSDALLWNNLAVAVRENPARLDEAIAISRKAVGLMPEHPDLHFMLASSLEQRGDHEEALSEFARCIQLKPSVPKYHRGRGRVLMKLHRWDEAETAYERALALDRRLDPRSAYVIFNLDQLARIKEAQGDVARAIEYFKQILEIDKDNGPAIRGIARLQASSR